MVISSIKKDFTLGNTDSYISGIYNNVQITSYGYYGGVQSNRTDNYPSWCAFNESTYNQSENVNTMLHKFFCPGNETYKNNYPVRIELKFLDGIKRYVSSCEINYGNTSSGQTKYYHKSIAFNLGGDTIYSDSNLGLLPRNTSHVFTFEQEQFSDVFNIIFSDSVNGGFIVNWIKILGYTEKD